MFFNIQNRTERTCKYIPTLKLELIKLILAFLPKLGTYIWDKFFKMDIRVSHKKLICLKKICTCDPVSLIDQRSYQRRNFLSKTSPVYAASLRNHWKSEKYLLSQHRHVGCLSKGLWLVSWHCEFRRNLIGLTYLKKKPQNR